MPYTPPVNNAVNFELVPNTPSRTANFVFDLTVTYQGYIKVWMGSSWIYKPVKIWDGSQWTIKPLKWYDTGTTSWVTTSGT